MVTSHKELNKSIQYRCFVLSFIINIGSCFEMNTKCFLKSSIMANEIHLDLTRYGAYVT